MFKQWEVVAITTPDDKGMSYILREFRWLYWLERSAIKACKELNDLDVQPYYRYYYGRVGKRSATITSLG